MLDKFSNRLNETLVRKIVIRRLPPEMDFQTFKKQIGPIPEHDYIYYVQGDRGYGLFSFSRAYINFIFEDDLLMFKEKFDDYVFLNPKGVEYKAVVEFAPFLNVPKERSYKKKDIKSGTIETCPYFQEFIRNLEKSKNNQHYEKKFSLYFQNKNDQKTEITPLLKYIKEKKKYKKNFKDSSFIFVNSSVKKRFHI